MSPVWLATAPAEHAQRVADRAVQPLARRRRSSVDRRPRRVDAGAPQRLVDEQVAEPGDARLVHEHRLDRRACARRARGRARASVSVERVGTEPRLVGIELDRAEPARVAEHERAAVGEAHAEAVPRLDRAGCSRRPAGRRPRRRRRARGRSSRGAARARDRRSVSSEHRLPAPARRGERVADAARARTAPASCPASGTTRRARAPSRSRDRARAPRARSRAASTSRISGTDVRLG